MIKKEKTHTLLLKMMLITLILTIISTSVQAQNSSGMYDHKIFEQFQLPDYFLAYTFKLV